ncbi:anti-sigma factor domain-containing protein [Crassaminicella thermophila]|uniref:anti-sigma factor domain-containing protein n=1 Tax=Crassaminicella thermophila TaxID=2599308 RepID=UPI00143D436E|nr:anti-sigma factor domain-containing protein [Crassaminicella thermophila]
MVYRGCVIKIEDDFVVVLTDKTQYIKVKKKDGLDVGKRIIFVKEDIYKEKKVTYKSFGMIAAIFMAMIFSVTLIGNLNISYGAAAVVSVDINPSIELEINKRNEVIKVTPLNEDGKELICEELKGKLIEEAIFVIITNAKQKNFITKEKNSILISTTVIKDDLKEKTKALENAIEEKIKQEKKLDGINIIYVEGNKKDLKEAKKQQISIGKYEVYKQSKEKNPKITLQQIKDMKVQEIAEKRIGKLKVKEVKIHKDKKDKKLDEKIENHKNDMKEIKEEKRLKLKKKKDSKKDKAVKEKKKNSSKDGRKKKEELSKKKKNKEKYTKSNEYHKNN